MINRVNLKASAHAHMDQANNRSGMIGAHILASILSIGLVLVLSVFLTSIASLASVLTGLSALIWPGLMPIFIAFLILLVMVIEFGMSAPIEVGLRRYYLHLKKYGTRPSAARIFEGFDHYLNLATVSAVRWFWVLLWPAVILGVTGSITILFLSQSILGSFYGIYGVAQGLRSVWYILFLIPLAVLASLLVGYYMWFRTWPMHWVQADNPQLNAAEAMALCKQLTADHMADLIVFELSFIGWRLLSWLTGQLLGLLYVQPYYSMTSALLYAELKHAPVELAGIEAAGKPGQPGRSGKSALPGGPCLQGTVGMYRDSTFPMEPNQPVVIGRDASVASIVLSQGAEKISRRHCTITFKSANSQYEVIDHSSNGIYVKGQKLPPNKAVLLPRGTEIALGNTANVFRLV